MTTSVLPRLHTLLPAAVLLAAPLAAQERRPGPPAAADFAVVDARVFDGERVLPRATVVVRGGRIASVSARRPTRLPATVVDGRGRTLLPGLIDAHFHTQGRELAMAEAPRWGVTTLLDLFGRPELDAQSRALGRRPDMADVRAAGSGATAPGGHGTQYGWPTPTITTPDSAEAFVAARVAEGSDFLKIIVEPGRATLDSATVRALVAAAHRRGLLAVAHVTRAADAGMVLRAGVDGLVHLWIDTGNVPAVSALAARRRAFVVPTMVLWLQRNSGGEEGRELAADPRVRARLPGRFQQAIRESPWTRALPDSLVRARRQDVPRLRRDLLDAVGTLHRAGVRIVAGSDAPNAGMSPVFLHRELELLVQAGLTPAEALATATSAPADAFRLADRGRVRPGLRADLLLVEGDPTTDVTATRGIVAVWKAGLRLADGPAPPSAPPGPPPGTGAAAPGFLYVWGTVVDTARSAPPPPDTVARRRRRGVVLAAVDLRAGSPTRGRVVRAVPAADTAARFAHHTEHALAADGLLFANDFGAGRTYRFDLRTPGEPRLLGDFTTAGPFSHPHSFVQLPGGNVLATYQRQGAGPPGGLVELRRDGTAVRWGGAAAAGADSAGIQPYSLEVTPALDRVVTTSHGMGSTPGGVHVQLWRLSDLALLHTLRIPPAPGHAGHGPHHAEGDGAAHADDHHRMPGEPRVLGDDRTVMIGTFTCGLYRLSGVEGPSPRLEFAHAFPGRDCALPVRLGRWWVQTVPAQRALVVLDTHDPARPRQVSRLSLGDAAGPHWLAADASGRWLVSNGGAVTDPRLYLAALDPATGALARHPEVPTVDLSRVEVPGLGVVRMVPHGVVFGPAGR